MSATRTPNPTPTALQALEPFETAEAILRVSRLNGREGDSFLSKDIQKQMIQEWAAANGVRIRKWWDETESISGKTTDRVGLKGAIDACMAGRSNGIIVARVDRFARNLPEGLAAIYRLREAGKTFAAVNEGVIGEVTRGPGKAMLTLLLMFAEWNLESLTDGWLATRASHVARGVHGAVAPYGYRKGEDRKLYPHEPEAKWVRHIFEQRAKGVGWVAIADDLTAQGAPTAKARNRWSHNSVRNVVVNRAYLGEVRSGDELVNPEAHEAIVDQELWDRANARMKTASPNKRVPALLAGIARCGSCGGRMRLASVTKAGVVYANYRCRERYSWGRCMAPASCRADQLDALMVAQFELDYPDDGAVLKPRATDREMSVALARLAQAKEDFLHFADSATMRAMREQHGQAFYDQTLASYSDHVAECQAAIWALSAIKYGSAVTAEEIQKWATPDAEVRRQILSRAYGAVVVWPNEVRLRRSSIDGRVRIIRANEAETDTLPGRGVAGSAITPIARAS